LIKNICKNCNSVLHGQFCSNCGQNKEQHVSFSDIKNDFLDEAFDYDARIFKTLKYLFINPGFLTKEYWKGKRIKYLQPIKLYILSSVFYYFINSLIKSTQTHFIFANKIASNIIDPKYYATIEDSILSYGQEIELLLFTPLTGAVLMILYKAKNKPFLHHMIASVHLSSFIFIFITIINMISILFSSINYLIDIFYLIIPIYTINMLRYIYNDSLIVSTLKALFIFISIIIRDIFIFGVGYIIAILIY
tara:strand:- start:149 stop:895 length:747 start_codon:yes stop_codon:yes gene_type:complete